MKKIISIVLVLVLCFGLVSCASNNDNTPTTTEPRLSDVELAAQTVLAALRNTMKNPDSFQVHSVNYGTFLSRYIFQIDYSAQNGFGGMNRKIKYVEYTSENNFSQYSDDEIGANAYKNSNSKSSIDISKLSY